MRKEDEVEEDEVSEARGCSERREEEEEEVLERKRHLPSPIAPSSPASDASAGRRCNAAAPRWQSSAR